MTLDARKEQLAALLAAGQSVRAAAAEPGVSQKTARNWLAALPALAGRVEAIRAESQARAVAILAASLTHAAATLLELLKPDHPPTVRLGASRAILADYVNLRQFTDLAGEVERLKQEVEALKPKGAGRRSA